MVHLKMEVIFNLLIGMAFFIIIVKVLWYMIGEYFTNRRNQKEAVNIDEQINKMIIKLGGTPSKNIKNYQRTDQKPKERKKKKKVLDLYEEKLNHVENQVNGELAKKDIEKIIILLKDLRWGGGESLAKLADEIKNHLKGKIKKVDIMRTFRQLEEFHFFLYQKEDHLLSYDELEKVIIDQTIFNCFFDDYMKKKANIFEILNLGNECLDSHFRNGFEIILMKNVPISNREIIDHFLDFRKITADRFQFRELGLKIIYNYSTNTLQGINHFYDLLKSYIKIFKEVEILKKDLTNISEEDMKFYQLLRVYPGCGMSRVKKSYNRMAKKYHPDRIDRDVDSTENRKLFGHKFNEVREAYDKVKEIEKKVSEIKKIILKEDKKL